MKNEKIVAECRRHWFHYVLYVLIILFLFYDLINELIYDTYASYKDFLLVAFIYSIISIIIVISIIKSYKNDYLRMTETQIVGHCGIIRTKTLFTPILKIQSIGYTNGLFGKIFGYHTVIVDNAGSGRAEFVFRHAAGAKNFVNAVQKRIS